MSRIFISYRRADSPAEAGRIYDYLEQHVGREFIFKDVDTINAGDNFRDHINQAVGQCQVLLAIIGKNWLQAKDANGKRRLDNAADWVRLEIETALDREIRVIPILLDGVEMPLARDLPTELQPLVYNNAARVRHDPDFRRDMEHILKVIGQDIANSFFLSGFKKYQKKNYQGAITDFNKALQLNPDEFVTYRGRGMAKSGLGDEQGAINDFNQALQLDPDHANTYIDRGTSKSALGDKQGAIADFNKALQLAPNNADAYNHRASAKSALGDNQGAINDYNQALQLNPDDAIAYNNRAVSKAVLGDEQGAIADYSKALQLKPSDAHTYLSRGGSKRDLRDKQGAIADFRQAAKLFQQQGNTEYYNHALSALKRLGGRL